MTGSGADRRPSESEAEGNAKSKDDKENEDDKLGWYIEKLLDLLSFF